MTALRKISKTKTTFVMNGSSGELKDRSHIVGYLESGALLLGVLLARHQKTEIALR
jgi:hypothetical protein